MAEWAEEAKQTPLRYEVDALEKERTRLTGKPW